MPGGARRLLLRPRYGCARRAGLVSCAWLAVTGAAFAEDRNVCREGDGAHIRKVCLSAGHSGVRYAHDVLGDTPEWTALTVFWGRGGVATFSQPDHVFEDIAPRLADLDGDGLHEILVVQSGFSKGARLVVLKAETGLTPISTPYIGQPYRWLAPVGAADLDGDGRVEIAFVDRPHLAKILRIWRFADGRLEHVADQPGLSNHQIGWDYIPGGIRNCGDGPEAILASGDWRRLMAVTFDGNAVKTREIGPYSGRESFKRAMSCS